MLTPGFNGHVWPAKWRCSPVPICYHAVRGEKNVAQLPQMQTRTVSQAGMWQRKVARLRVLLFTLSSDERACEREREREGVMEEGREVKRASRERSQANHTFPPKPWLPSHMRMAWLGGCVIRLEKKSSFTCCFKRLSAPRSWLNVRSLSLIIPSTLIVRSTLKKKKKVK